MSSILYLLHIIKSKLRCLENSVESYRFASDIHAVLALLLSVLAFLFGLFFTFYHGIIYTKVGNTYFWKEHVCYPLQ